MKKTILLFMLALFATSQSMAMEYEYTPFVREGVKWVYVINNINDIYEPNPLMPEGKYYRKLEVKGDTIINGTTYKMMHKYSGDNIDPENDTVPVFIREENKIVYGIIPDGRKYSDCPIGTMSDVGAYSGQEFILYNFANTVTYWDCILNYDDIAFFEYLGTDTISIGSRTAKRHKCLYSGNEFYYVEGVGMDAVSYGYTLCFFMGYIIGGGSATFHFSHVIENGEIVYKGIYYDPNVHDGIGEVAAEKTRSGVDNNYYDLMGRAVGKNVPTTPGIYIHQGKKIVIR